MSKPHRVAALHRLLDEDLYFAPEYDGGSTNHLPMALAALDGLNADEARLKTFFATYARRLATAQAGGAVRPISDWSVLRGRFEAFRALEASFLAALKREGRDAVLRRTLPLLVTGIAAAAFHGVIRVAHAVESGHDPELAAGLAYWAARWMPLSAPVPVEPDIRDVTEWLAVMDRRLRRDDARAISSGSQIDVRMRTSGQTDAYRQEAGRLRTTDRDVDAMLFELSLHAAARYARTRDFVVLHIATSARAARVLIPWLSSDGAAWAAFWHAAAAASLAASAATSAPTRSYADTGLDWPQVKALARAHDDEHVVKLVHAMSSQNAAAPHRDWLRAATVAVSA